MTTHTNWVHDTPQSLGRFTPGKRLRYREGDVRVLSTVIDWTKRSNEYGMEFVMVTVTITDPAY